MGRGTVRGVMVAVVVLGSMVAWPDPGQAARFAVRHRSVLLPGLEVQGLRDANLSVDVGRVARDAPVRVEVVTAGAVAGAVETTTEVCRRVGGILCVNGDFSECRTCSTAFGGIVHDGVLQRSPVADHQQLTLGPAGPAAGRLGWSATLQATVTYLEQPPLLGLLQARPTERVETVTLALDSLNRARGPNQVVLYTPPWGATTLTRGGDEAVLRGGAPVVGATVPVTPVALQAGSSSTAIPGDGMVLSAEGAGSSRLRAFWAKAADPAAARRSVVLRPTLERPAEESVGGHPVVLSNGETVIGGAREPFATGRHPRTLVGWNPAGDLLLVTVDGRQPGHSAGVSLVEAAEVLRQAGATSGFNLDGGGSSTFVSLAQNAGRTPQVLNRPSDGNERRVSTVVAVVPLDPSAVRTNVAPPPPPPPPPAPPGPPPVDEASTDGIAANRGQAPAPATTAAPTTTGAPITTTTVPPPAAPITDPADLLMTELAAPPPPPPRPGQPSTGGPAAVAGLALVAAAAATIRCSRRRGVPAGAEPDPPDPAAGGRPPANPPAPPG